MRLFKRKHRRVVLGSGILLGALALLFVARGSDAGEPRLVQIETKDKDGTDFAMRATEIERGEKTSTIKVIRKKRLSSVGSCGFVMQAAYEIAKARKCEYFTYLKGWEDKDGSLMFVAGFTNKKDADIKQEFGDQFQYENEQGQKRKLFSVSQSAPLFEQMREAAKPPRRSDQHRQGVGGD